MGGEGKTEDEEGRNQGEVRKDGGSGEGGRGGGDTRG